MPALPTSGTIGGSRELEGALKDGVRTKLLSLMTSADQEKYKDQPIYMTLAFEENAECFNPIFFFGEPPESPTSVTPHSEGSME